MTKTAPTLHLFREITMSQRTMAGDPVTFAFLRWQSPLTNLKFRYPQLFLIITVSLSSPVNFSVEYANMK